MVWKYQATERDLKIIKQGISLIWDKRLKKIFWDKRLIKDTNVISFDSQFLYLWIRRTKTNWKLIKIKHNISFHKKDLIGWKAGLPRSEIYQYLPDNRKNNFAICGSLLAPFLGIHRTKKIDNYSTVSSYLATIIHEFAHVYYRNFVYNRLYSQSQNIYIIKTALKISSHQQISTKNLLTIYPPPPGYLDEVFAFCVEYKAAKILFPKHAQNIDKFDSFYLQRFLDQEEMRKKGFISIFEKQDSHLLAMIFGRIFLKKYPQTWKKRLLYQLPIFPPQPQELKLITSPV